MLYCNRQPNHNSITTCISEKCQLKYKLLCCQCDSQLLISQHNKSCSFAELKLKLNYFDLINLNSKVNNLEKNVKKNRIKQIQFNEEDTEITDEQIVQVQEINDCIKTYNKYQHHIISVLFDFVKNQRTWYLNNFEQEIQAINSQTSFMILQMRNYESIINDLQDLVSCKHQSLNSNLKSVNLSTQGYFLQCFCSDILSIINHFQIQISCANTWFSNENARVVQKHRDFPLKKFDQIKPYLIKISLDGFLMGECIKDQGHTFINVYSLLNPKNFNQFQMKIIYKINSQVFDFDFSSCEKYLAFLDDNGFHLVQQQLQNQENNTVCKFIDLAQSPPLHTINEKFEKVQFYIRRDLVTLQNKNKLTIFNYKKLQLFYSINSNFIQPFQKQMSMLTEFLLIQSDKSADIFEQNGDLKQIQYPTQQQNVKQLCISQNYKHLMLLLDKEGEKGSYFLKLFTYVQKELNYNKLLLNILIKNVVKVEFSVDSNYIYILYDNKFEVIDTHVLQHQQGRNFFFQSQDNNNPYTNLYQTFDGEKLYFLQLQGQIIVTEKVVLKDFV